MLIHLPDVTTYPESIKSFVETNEYELQRLIEKAFACDRGLEILREEISYSEILTDAKKLNLTIKGWHVTRLLQPDIIWQEGLKGPSSDLSKAEKHYREMFSFFEFDNKDIERIIAKMKILWQDSNSRLDTVHLFTPKELLENHAPLYSFAENIGGEIVNWGLRSLDENLYRKEPFKRLWIEGIPCIIGFKFKFCNLIDSYKDSVLSIIITNYLASKILKIYYKPEATLCVNGIIEPSSILSIDEIENFIEIQETQDEYIDFY